MHTGRIIGLLTITSCISNISSRFDFLFMVLYYSVGFSSEDTLIVIFCYCLFKKTFNSFNDSFGGYIILGWQLLWVFLFCFFLSFQTSCLWLPSLFLHLLLVFILFLCSFHFSLSNYFEDPLLVINDLHFLHDTFAYVFLSISWDLFVFWSLTSSRTFTPIK